MKKILIAEPTIWLYKNISAYLLGYKQYLSKFALVFLK